MSRTNSLISISVLVFLILCVWIIFLNEGGDPSPPNANTTDAIPEGVGPSVSNPSSDDPAADTTGETLKTVAAGYQNVQTALESTRIQIIELQENSEDISVMYDALTTIKNELAAIKSGFSSAQTQRAEPAQQTAIPNADAFHDIGSLDIGFSDQVLDSSSGYVRIKPLYQTHREVGLSADENTGQGSLPPDVDGLQVTHPESLRSPLANNQTSVLEHEATPYLSIAPNSTLFDSTAMTALIGRVPNQGSITDPLPVKIIIGNENLVANGHRISGLNGMIFSGSAVGDWTLSCVRVRLHTATFVFADGSFTALGAGGYLDGSDDGQNASAATENHVIGWLSDQRGNPCIPGKKISDAPKRLSTLSLLGLAQGAANSYASSEQTTVVNNGATTRSVTGDNTRFLLGNAASSSLDSAIGVMRQRFADHFDAIYAPPGTSVVVNIDTELRIDQRSSQRKLQYAKGKTDVTNTLD